MESFSYKLYREYCIAYLGNACVRCSSVEQLEIDHIDPSTKLYSISKSWATLTKELLDTELDKCQLLCKDCHAAKTAIDLSGERGWTHGTMYGWMKKRCTCEMCIEAKLLHYKARKQAGVAK